MSSGRQIHTGAWVWAPRKLILGNETLIIYLGITILVGHMKLMASRRIAASGIGI